MANVAILDENGELFRYLESVHTPDFIDKPNCIINPEPDVIEPLIAARQQKDEKAREDARSAAKLAADKRKIVLKKLQESLGLDEAELSALGEVLGEQA